MRSFKLALAFLLVFSSLANAKSPEAFKKRFELVRAADGQLVGIRDRSINNKFAIRPYVEFIKEQILNEQKLIKKNGLVSYEDQVRNLLGENAVNNLSDDESEYVNHVVESLKELAGLNVEAIFGNETFKKVTTSYEVKMNEALNLLDPHMVAVVDDSSYFYKRNVTYKAVTWGLDLAKRMFSDVPMLNTASYVIVQIEKKITEQRNFHQNMLLHYLENFKEEELGLTHDEVNHIWSSIYESRIPWFAFWESKKARANWYEYGAYAFYANYRGANQKLKANSARYTGILDRPNFAFQEVNLGGDKVIVNLFDNESLLQRRPAVAFNYNHPGQIARKRALLTLANLGLSFVPLNDFIKGNVEKFIKSYFEKQRITEGALYGYFESKKDKKGMDEVKAQYLNPFDFSL